MFRKWHERRLTWVVQRQAEALRRPFEEDRAPGDFERPSAGVSRDRPTAGWALPATAPAQPRVVVERVLADGGLSVVLESVPLPGEQGSDLLVFFVPGRDALATWSQLRDLLGSTGRWPVIVGEPDVARDVVAGPSVNGLPAGEVLAAFAEMRPWSQWYSERTAYVYTAYGDLSTGEDVIPQGEPFGFSTPLDLTTREPLEAVSIALVPTVTPWEVPAYLTWGGWNDCPYPDAHMLTWQHWHQVYGAEVVAMTSDIVEMRVGRPPTSTDGALTLAREHYAYAPDIAAQSLGSVEAHAGLLMGQAGWFFWWD
jgi:hypothetical protein